MFVCGSLSKLFFLTQTNSKCSQWFQNVCEINLLFAGCSVSFRNWLFGSIIALSFFFYHFSKFYLSIEVSQMSLCWWESRRRGGLAFPLHKGSVVMPNNNMNAIRPLPALSTQHLWQLLHTWMVEVLLIFDVLILMFMKKGRLFRYLYVYFIFSQ